MRRRLLAAAATAAVVLSLANVGRAASPTSDSVGPSDPSTTWNGQSYAAGAIPDPSACTASDTLCDHYSLKADVKSSYWKTHTGGMTVSIAWSDSGDNFDLYVYKSGDLTASSGSGSSKSESVFISEATGSYSVLVVPKQVVDSAYSGSAVFSSETTSTGGGGGTTGGGGGGTTGGRGGSGTGGGTNGGSGAGGGTNGGTGGSGSSGLGTTGTPGSVGTCAGCSFGGNTVSQETIIYTYGLDRTSWYWSKQVDEDVEAGPFAQRVHLPNPQSKDTLPVAVDKTEADKEPALYIDLTNRGIQPGSTIVQFILKIAESDNRSGEQPEFNTDGKQILACGIKDGWAAGAAELWDLRPPFSESTCAEGKRGGKPDAQSWTFDLTDIAQPWGEDPLASNFGVMFVPVIAKDAGPNEGSWQVNLKIPAADDPTTDADEYNDTKKRMLATVSWTAPVGTDTDGDGLPDTGTTVGPGGSISGGQPFGTISGGTAPISGSPSTGTPITGTSTPPATTINPVSEIPTPTLPGIVWALIPIGILLLYALRSALLEPVGMRTEGVIAAIRRRNAAARGETVEEPGDVLTQARDATKRARTAIRRGLRRR